jgi:hypothetical protein
MALIPSFPTLLCRKKSCTEERPSSGEVEATVCGHMVSGRLYIQEAIREKSRVQDLV